MTSVLSRGGYCSAKYITEKEDISTPAGRGMTSLVPKGDRVSEAFYASQALINVDPRHVRFAPYTEREETENSMILRAPYLALGNGYARAMSIMDAARLQAWLAYHSRAIDSSLDILLLNKHLTGLVPGNLVYDRERDIFLLADFYYSSDAETGLFEIRRETQKYLGSLGPTINPPPNAMMM